MLNDLKGKRALITGSSTGIGATLAKSFAGMGVAVAVHANSSIDTAQKVVDEITAAGGTAVLVAGDVSDSAQAKRIVDEAAQKLGGLDILINNAGSVIRRENLSEFDDELFHQVIDVNVKSVIQVTNAAIPHLQKSGGGSIINTGSVAGRNGGRAGSGVYAAAKAAVHSLSRNMAYEYAGDNIRVNTIAPGVVVTPFHKDNSAEKMEIARKAVPLGRLGQTEDCVGAYAFLASSNMSGWITGQIIDVNGGAFMA